ncbi:hypothetical protein SUGI_0298690 [Cryptomeria japonica]|nr:hypothetical protein SUGI_0298690 [Cryptomeria japonica]
MDDISFEFDGISAYGDPISAEMIFHNGLIRPVNHYQQHRPDNLLPYRSITKVSDENQLSQGIGKDRKSFSDYLISSPPAKQVQKKSNVSKHGFVRYSEREIIEKPVYGRKTVNGYATNTRRLSMSDCNCSKAHENRRKSFLPCCFNASGAVENCHEHFVTKPKGSPHSRAR